MAKRDVSTHWRDSSRIPRFFIIDARAALGIVVFLFHPRWWSLCLAAVIVVILAVLNYYKITLPAAFRLMRGFISGSNKVVGKRS